jgi:PIN domain nuclease of toxin-antitoxin system
VTPLLLDTHVLYWWSSNSTKLSTPAVTAIGAADRLAVSAITWFELAWLAEHGRIRTAVPTGSWLADLAVNVDTVAITPAVATTAVALPPPFPGDPMDRLIYATAIEHGLMLVTKDSALRGHRHPRPITLW